VGIYEHHTLARKIWRIPLEVLRRYEKWKDIVVISGPDGLKQIKGFHDEALKGQWGAFDPHGWGFNTGYL